MQTRNRESGFLGSIPCCRSKAQDGPEYRYYGGHGVFPFVPGRSWSIPFPTGASDERQLEVSNNGGIALVSEGHHLSLVLTEHEMGCLDIDGSEMASDERDSYFNCICENEGHWRVFSAHSGRTVPSELPTLSIVGPGSVLKIPIDGSWGPISSLISVKHGKESLVFLGHSSGILSYWSHDGSLMGSSRLRESSILSLACDMDFLYVLSADGNICVFRMCDIFSPIPEAALVVPMGIDPDCVTKLIIPWGKTTGGYPGTHILVLCDNGDLVRIPLNTQDSSSLSILVTAITDAVFGPFDNGPLVTARGHVLSVHQQGSYKAYAEMHVEVEVERLAVSRDHPALWFTGLCDTKRELYSFVLRESLSQN